MGRNKKRGKTLGGIFLSYVLVMLVALFIWGISTLLIFNIFVNTGRIYPANYAEQKINEAYDLIQSADVVTEDMIPPLCRYLIFSLDGEVLGGNMTEDSIKIAWKAANHEQTSGSYFYKVISRQDEYVVLQYSLTPQYQSAFLREHFIDPQNLLTILFLCGGIVIILLPSVHFGKKMKEKIQPLLGAVDKIKNQELEYTVPNCGVKEIDACLLSIDEMRTALKTSLTRQWKTEQEKNRQMSALAHDIKTPLTVVRGNAELLSETDLHEEQKKYMDYIISSSLQIQNYVETLIEVTKSAEVYQKKSDEIKMDNLLGDIHKQALGLTEVCRLKMEWKEAYDNQTVYADYEQIVRAVMNIIKNATEHTPEGGNIKINIKEQSGKLEFVVEDTGSGFTQEALAHGTEQFFMDDTSRNGKTHYGIGLFSARTIAKKHGGEILLANSEDTGGAKVMITFSLV